eukprot:NODE_27_length_33950_cov_0.349739.p20 type:complete len:107 gc:universal NODE_27_length_33950_cov_0.349739:17869-17549(-)
MKYLGSQMLLQRDMNVFFLYFRFSRRFSLNNRFGSFLLLQLSLHLLLQGRKKVIVWVGCTQLHTSTSGLIIHRLSRNRRYINCRHRCVVIGICSHCGNRSLRCSSL